MAFPHPSLFGASAQGGSRWNFCMKLILQKLEGRCLYGEDCMILTSTVFDDLNLSVWRTERQTDRHAIASIYRALYMLYSDILIAKKWVSFRYPVYMVAPSAVWLYYYAWNHAFEGV